VVRQAIHQRTHIMQMKTAPVTVPRRPDNDHAWDCAGQVRAHGTKSPIRRPSWPAL
jgi:hypothetical protein